jgi:hypothetical protein
MISLRLKFSRTAGCVLFILLAFPLVRNAQGVGTSQRTIPSFSWGNRTYTCLLIDGGEVPLAVPPVGGPVIHGGGGEVTITWPKDGTIAVIRTGSRAEAALLDLMGKQEAADAWKKYMASTLRGPGYTFTVHDFQPDRLSVNHWRIGAITMDYAVGGRKSSSLVMLWRCKDGSTLAVTMQSGPDEFKGHYDELITMIGNSLVIPPGR